MALVCFVIGPIRTEKPGANNRTRAAGIFPEGIVLSYSRPIAGKPIAGIRKANTNGFGVRRVGVVRLHV